jgi:predicted ribosome quality control (RQC) complex YloA/Tae2 family protein
MIEQARQEKDRLEDILVFARLARTEGDLRALRTEIRPEANAATGRKPSPRRGPARFLRDGVEALVGRNARENEELTFRLAQRNDLWLHARQRTGAHVVLRGNTVDDDAIRAAAGLAAYFSEGRSDSAVDVDVTEVRNVRKIPGGPTGRVTYGRHRTLHVAPSAEGWEPGG